MVNPIPEFVRNTWSKWDIRCVVLTSLLLQIVLTFLTPFRKRTKNSIVLMLVWFAYIFADAIAIYGVGHISDKYRGDEEDTKDNIFLIVLWTPFLLLHLGGPDTITAFSVEDNELWLRHLLGLVVQVCLTAYVILLTLPANTFWLPTTLVFLAGIIKFSERTRSLQLASVGNLSRRHLKYQPSTQLALKFHRGKVDELDMSSEMDKHKKENLDGVAVATLAYILFNFSKSHFDTSITPDTLFTGIRFDHDQVKAIDALRVVEVALNFMYDAFYTKASLVHSKVGFFFRFVSVSSIVAAFLLFAFDQKHGCNEFDVKVTYTLFYGAVALDAVSLLMLIFSDYAFVSLKARSSVDLDGSLKRDYFIRCVKTLRTLIVEPFLNLREPKWLEGTGQKKLILCWQIWCPRWSESISGFNYISYCLHNKRGKGGWVEKTIDCIGFREWTYEEKHPFLQELWIFIFMQTKRKFSHHWSLFEWFIQNNEILRDDRDKWKPFVDVEDSRYSFEERIIQWHIATTLLFYAADDIDDVEQGSGNVDHKNDQADDELHRDFSKLLSDYLIHLSIWQPTVTSALMEGGRFEVEWRRCCDYATDFFIKLEDDGTEKNTKLKRVCIKFYRNEDFRDKGSLGDAIKLTDLLTELKGHKWEIIAQVWVDLLRHAAENSRPINLVRQLGKGGEFISLVWLLVVMLTFGRLIRP